MMVPDPLEMLVLSRRVTKPNCRLALVVEIDPARLTIEGAVAVRPLANW